MTAGHVPSDALAPRGTPDHSTVEQMLSLARAGIARLTPSQAHAEMSLGAVLVDIRSDSQRAADGDVPRAVAIPRNVLEWRCDPTSRWRDERASDPRRRLIVLCDEGYQSSFAAATLRTLGHSTAADVIGGFRAWRAAGLPVLSAEETPFLRHARG